MARFWTYHWQFRLWRTKHNPEGGPVRSSGSNSFRKRGVSVDDTVYVISLGGGQLYLGGRMLVQDIVTRSAAMRHLKRRNLHSAKQWILGSESAGTPLHLRRRLSPALTKQLRFILREGPRAPLFVSNSKLHNQATRGIREITPESAALFERIIQATDQMPRSERLLTVTRRLLQETRLSDEVPSDLTFREHSHRRDSMAYPTRPAEQILRVLLEHIEGGEINPDNPATFLGYSQVHDALGLPMKGETIGNSLKNQGLADLAEWTKAERLPAITGLIVDKSQGEHYLSPGDGYFRLFGKRYPHDALWWLNEVRRSMEFDWASHLDPESEPQPVAVTTEYTDEAIDLRPPPERIKATVYRILRDTEIAQRVKALHEYRCQICGHRIELPNGRFYAEAHHVQPLGQPHNGPDVIGNILCLCPNHHAEVDLGACKIELPKLRVAAGHAVDGRYITYHNDKVSRSNRG